MKLTRAQKIEKGMIWQVYPDGKSDEPPMFEGSHAACVKYLREHGLMRDWRKGKIRTGKIIWEEAS